MNRHEAQPEAGAGRLCFQCDLTPQAEHFRLSIVIVGTDPEFLELDSTKDLNQIVEALSADATVKIKMRAVNEVDTPVRLAVG